MKPTDLIIVMGYNAGDAPAAERLLDWIFELSGKKQLKRTIVVVAAPNVHPEMQTKVRLAAQVAFENVEAYVAGNQILEKVDGTNKLFKTGAVIAANNFRQSWLWLEPDCVPLTDNWLESLEKGYANQPKRFFGPYCKFVVGNDQRKEEKMCMGIVACYPPNAIDDLAPYCDALGIPFNRVAAETIVMRSTKCRLIQQLNVVGNADLPNIRPDAVLLHCDKSGIAIEYVRHTRDKSGKGRVKSSTAPTIANEIQEAD